MKKLEKITLSKKYDVLSKNEMKKVVGGSDLDCKGLIMFKCYDNRAYVSGVSTTICAPDSVEAERRYCSNSASMESCLRYTTCS